MSRDPRTNYYNRNRDWDRSRSDRDRGGYRYEKSRPPVKRSPPRDLDKRRSRSPRGKNEKDLDENILSEISKLPEPSELWDAPFQEASFPAPPASFPPEVTSVQAPSYGASYQPTPYSSGIYDDFPPVSAVAAAPVPPEMAAWNQMSLPPPPAPATMFAGHSNVDDQMKKEAIESEMRHQKAALSKQREDYIKKAGILKKELDTLKDQRNELRGDAKRSPSPDTKRFLKENTKLQLEIQNKLKTINNVVDMLNGIIGEEAQEHHDTDDASERSSKRKSRSPTNKKFNYVYYDPEMHWCRVCNDFPPTAKDYLNHLHSPAHHKMAAAHMEAPWHTVTGVNEGFPSFPSAPTKRTPIRGLQFFVPSTAWYCKLCDQFIGDLHCASAHLKSVVHSKNYTNFVEQNPHWETDWMSDRQKAFEKARASNKLKPEEKGQYAAHTITFSADGFHTTRKDSPPPDTEKKKKRDKKKKKRKRSSSSSSSTTNSTDSEPVKKKKSKKDKNKHEPDEKTLTQWMSTLQTDRLTEHDRKLLDSFKERMKLDKKDEKRRSVERSSVEHQRKREQDRHERREPIERRDERRRDERRDVERRDERRDVERRDERRDPERRDDRRDGERRDDRRDSSNREGRVSPRADHKKPEIRKMPFIGKMPVYKNLNKTKTEEQKKDDQKKKEEEEASKKRREVMDAEIQKKVAEFKEKIAKAQMERAAAELPPPAVALPTALGAPPHLLPLDAPPLPAPAAPPAPASAPPPPAAPPTPALPKDFQEALDIIFPTEVKNAANEMVQAQQELFNMGALPPFPLGMPPFPQLSLLGQPPMPSQVPMMMPFDLNGPLFQHRPQLYDTHVPLVPAHKRHNNKNRQNKNNNHNQNQNKNNQNNQAQKASPAPEVKKEPEDKKPPEKAAPATRNKEELDELAMLGIDASDVGAGI